MESKLRFPQSLEIAFAIATFPQVDDQADGKVENQKQVSHFPTARRSFLKKNPRGTQLTDRGAASFTIFHITGMYICGSPFLALLSGTGKRVGSAPQASEAVFREGPDDIVYGVSKSACAGNVGWKPKPGGPQNWRVQSARARGFTPMLCRPEGRKRDGSRCEQSQS
jgi:hypothetical protein